MKKIVNFFKKIYNKFFGKPKEVIPQYLLNAKEIIKKCPVANEDEKVEKRTNDLIKGRKEINYRKHLLGHHAAPKYVDFNDIETHNSNKSIIYNQYDLGTLKAKIEENDKIILENQKKLK